MSYAASSQGKAHAGIDLAAAAQSLAVQTDDPLLRVCAAERAGTAYAVDGQYKPCLTEFDKAQEGMLSAEDAPPESPAYYYHEGLLASHQSECLLLLEKPREAVASASTGLTVFNSRMSMGTPSAPCISAMPSYNPVRSTRPHGSSGVLPVWPPRTGKLGW